MAALLRNLGVAHDEVKYVSGTEPDPVQSTKLRFVSEALRPSDTTERWQDFLGEAPDIRSALSSLQIIAAPTAQDEAEAIALILRSTIEAKGKTAALVTPDRTLARRVAARLRGFGLTIDDSAGTPVVRTVPGAFLDLVLEAVDADFNATPLEWAIHGSEHGWYAKSGDYGTTVELLLRAGAKRPDTVRGSAAVRAALQPAL